MTTKKHDVTTPDPAAAPEGVAISEKEVIAARSEGAKEAVKEQAKDTYKALTDGALPGDPEPDPYLGSDESNTYAYMLEDGPDAFDERVNGKDSPVTDVMAAGLLKLERAGQNRTPYVKTLLKRLGLKGKDIHKVTDAGPNYTNDLSNISDL